MKATAFSFNRAWYALIVICCVSFSLRAQVSAGYTFFTTVSQPYPVISGGHVLGGANDDDNYYLDSIGFTFTYNLKSYTACYVDANGYIVLGYTVPSATYFAGHPLSLNANCIAAFTNDLQGQNSSASEMRIQTIGTSPYRTCVIQWSDWGLYPAPATTTANEHYNFQIRLNENNGNGSVDIVYGGMYSGHTSTSPIGTISGTLGVQAGMTGDSVGDYNDRTSTNWTSTSAGGSPGAAITAYNGNMPDSGRVFTWKNQILNDSITSAPQTVCAGVTPSTILGSAPSGGFYSYTYQWQSSTTSPTSGFSTAGGTNNTQDYSPSSLATTTWFRRIVNSGASYDTTAAVEVTVTNTNTWTGLTSTAWANAGNWDCGRIPVTTDSVIINSSTTNMPVVVDGGRVAKHLVIFGFNSLTVNNASSDLSISGTFIINGTLSHTNGSITLNGSSSQQIPGASYYNLAVSNASGANLSGNVTINGTLTMAAGNLSLGNSSLTLAGTSSAISGATATRYIVTDGTGTLNVQTMGVGGRSSAVTFPVGTSTSYNPATVTNIGTQDEYRVRVYAGVSTGYTSGGASVGTPVTANAVNRTWIVNEATAGGSLATVLLQWNAADEQSGFTRSSCFVSRFSNVWQPNTASAASGSGPYTQSRTGITAFSPFGVGSGTTLPVELISFTGRRTGTGVLLNWSTASERSNDRFTIERSADGSIFEAIGMVKGQGTTDRTSQYTFSDPQPLRATAFYRLVQTDFDGASQTSRVITVNGQTNLSAATVSPDPFGPSFSVSLDTDHAGAVALTLTDMAGRVLKSVNAQAHTGSNSITFDNLDVLNAGLYLLLIEADGNREVRRVVKE